MTSPRRSFGLPGILLFGLISTTGLLWGCSHSGSWCQTSRTGHAFPQQSAAQSKRPNAPRTTTTPTKSLSAPARKIATAGTRAMPKTKAPQAKPFAVVELFTSEGCSSCPPADRLAGSLGRLARKHGKRIFPIVYHVDYWDHLGWRDRFGKRIFTQLQQGYSRVFGRSGLYTPQMVVNGRWEFVGSHRRTAAAAIKRALQHKPRAHISLCTTSSSKRQLRGRYEVQPPLAGTQLGLAVVEWGLISRVTSGENAGQKLRNDEVARAFEQQTLPTSGKGTYRLTLPRRLKRQHAALIAFLRNSRDFRIVAASRLALHAPSRCR